MTDELELVRESAPPAAGPEPALVAREREALMSLIRQADHARAPEPESEPPGSVPSRPVPNTVERRPRRLALPALGAAAAVALVVAGVAAVGGRDRSTVASGPESRPATTTTAPAGSAGPFDTVAAWHAAWDGDDQAGAYALLGPKSKATLEAQKERRQAPGFVDGPDDSDWDELWRNHQANRQSPSYKPITYAPRDQWEFLPLPDDPTAGVVVEPGRETTGSTLPVVKASDGRWLVEFWAFGSDATRPGPETAPPPGGWDQQSPDDPFELLGPRGDYYTRLDGRGPLQPMQEMSPGRYRAAITYGQLTGGGDHDVLVVWRDPVAFQAHGFAYRTGSDGQRSGDGPMRRP